MANPAMKEGEAYRSAEAGPSMPQYFQKRAWSTTRISSGSGRNSVDGHPEYIDDAAEEDRHEQEAQVVENALPQHPQVPPRPPSNRVSSFQATPRRKPLMSIDLPLHTSASEIFQSITPAAESEVSEKPTTYSSLPPSPRGEFIGSPRGRMDSGDLEGRLQDMVNRESDREYQTGSETDLDEVFWPAGSRRPSFGEENELRQGKDDNVSMSPDSPSSPATAGPELAGSGEERETDERVEGKEYLSVWNLLKDEMGSDDWDEWTVDGKWERIANFLAVPLAVEKTTLFGALLCLDGFLYNFTVLPIRAIFALARIISNLWRRKTWWPIPIPHVNSILRMLLIVIPTGILLVGTDASKMYHTVRGQDTIKLYVIFNALEIADRLCCAFGQDLLDTLFARETLSPSVRKLGKGKKRQQARPVFFFALSLGYVLLHSVIFFYMLVSLNVAINSYDYTLLSLLISNQFVEIKGSVFKKFEKENLFQIMCADIVERFQLSLMLAVIAIRNIIEMSGSDIAFLPKSFMRGKSLVDAILSPVLFVILSEMMVDWLKHAFISKFNHVRASVYERFTDVLAKDVLLAGSTGSRYRFKGKNHRILLDQSPLVARRLGFASIPLACLVMRISFQAIGMLTSHHGEPHDFSEHAHGGWTESVWWGLKVGSWVGVGVCAWGSLVFFKVVLGLSLLGFSAMRQEGMDEREAEDKVNDFGRSDVGETKEEAEYNRQTSEFLARPGDNLPHYPSPATANALGRVPMPRPKNVESFTNLNSNESEEYKKVDKPAPAGDKKGKKWRLEEVERWTMVKRIW